MPGRQTLVKSCWTAFTELPCTFKLQPIEGPAATEASGLADYLLRLAQAHPSFDDYWQKLCG